MVKFPDPKGGPPMEVKNEAEARSRGWTPSMGSLGINSYPDSDGGGPSGPSGPSSPNVTNNNTDALRNFFSQTAGFSREELEERKRQFNEQMKLVEAQWAREGLPRLEIDKRLADMRIRQAEADISLQRERLGIERGQLGLSFLTTAANMGGPADYFQQADFLRGARTMSGVPQYLQALGQNAPVAAFSGVGNTPPRAQNPLDLIGQMVAMGQGGGPGGGWQATPGLVSDSDETMWATANPEQKTVYMQYAQGNEQLARARYAQDARNAMLGAAGQPLLPRPPGLDPTPAPGVPGAPAAVVPVTAADFANADPAMRETYLKYNPTPEAAAAKWAEDVNRARAMSSDAGAPPASPPGAGPTPTPQPGTGEPTTPTIPVFREPGTPVRGTGTLPGDTGAPPGGGYVPTPTPQPGTGPVEMLPGGGGTGPSRPPGEQIDTANVAAAPAPGGPSDADMWATADPTMKATYLQYAQNNPTLAMQRLAADMRKAMAAAGPAVPGAGGLPPGVIPTGSTAAGNQIGTSIGGYNQDATLNAIGSIFRRGPTGLTPGSLERLDPDELALMGSGGRKLGYDPASWYRAYQRAGVGQQAGARL